jgi:hypothetical protein
VDWGFFEEDDFQTAWANLLAKGNRAPARNLLTVAAKHLALNRLRDSSRRPRLAARAHATDGDASEFIPRRPPSQADVAEARKVLRLLARYPDGRKLIRHALGAKRLTKNQVHRARERLREKGLKFPADLVEESSIKRRTR